jgi:hypothetical protein
MVFLLIGYLIGVLQHNKFINKSATFDITVAEGLAVTTHWDTLLC